MLMKKDPEISPVAASVRSSEEEISSELSTLLSASGPLSPVGDKLLEV
jgi:hypothetical protein